MDFKIKWVRLHCHPGCHGLEHRLCEVVDQLGFLDGWEERAGLKSVVRITSERTIKQTGKGTTETRYYITSLKADAKLIHDEVRNHWAVENNLYWSLDVMFKENASLKKKDHSALNLNRIAKMALTLIDQENKKE